MPSMAEDTMQNTLEAVEVLCRRYGIVALDEFIHTCRSFAGEEVLNVAVFGRFKTGKSSFINHLAGRDVLPVEVIPVTAVVTEVQYGPQERVEVRFLDGHSEFVPVDRIRDFVSESENPENTRKVAFVRVELPSLERYRGIRLVDTPGMESIFEHNTAASLDWLPNAGLALIAVSADCPLSQSDMEFIRKISRYTPRVFLLLTKVDLLNDMQRGQVVEFVGQQLERYLGTSIPVMQYSIRSGFDELHSRLDHELLPELIQTAGSEHAAILRHKLQSLLEQCTDYLQLALRSAEVADAEREELRRNILGQKEALEDIRLGIRLIVRHAAESLRSTFEALLIRNEEAAIRERLLSELNNKFPSWTSSFRDAMEQFSDWLHERLADEMRDISEKHYQEFVEPVRDVSRQLSQSLENFRNRISERTLKALGVPLPAAEMDLDVKKPQGPDIRVGKIFDRNWELISPLIPMGLLGGPVQRHFERKLAYVVFMNLSRLAAQWETTVNGALLELETESLQRLESLVTTIENLVSSAGQEVSNIHTSLTQLDALRERLLG